MVNYPELRRLLEAFVEHHVVHGEMLSAEELCGDRVDLIAPLRDRIASYLSLNLTLDRGLGARSSPQGQTAKETPTEPADPPRIEGFEVIERIGGGGMGEVFKLRDRKLDRIVAGKILRRDAARPPLALFLQEARAQALFQDERIVRVLEFRDDADPPVLILEHVEGFRLDHVAPSLEYAQRARILLEVCEAVDRAHGLGLQHRDLKPANIMVVAALKPKILDFGLAGGDPTRGHFQGTPQYLAPEQLDPELPIDERTDVYALGVILYELLCGVPPYRGDTLEEILKAVRAAEARLPVEYEPSVPEPLQAIALRAMERDPAARYPSAQEMAQDLRRYLEGRPVLARPSHYGSALGKKIEPHLEQIGEWTRQKLIYPHEEAKLRVAYERLQAREDDWIVESRVLSWSQITLYLAVALLTFGGILYFLMHRFFDGVHGFAGPLLVLGGPFLVLNVAGYALYRRDQKAVSIAFALAAVILLPLLLIIGMHELGLWVASSPDGQLLALEDTVPISNRQLQSALLAGVLWALALAFQTRTTALAAVFTALTFLLTLSVLSDLGLREWIEEGRFDLLAMHLSPLVLAMGLAGDVLEKRQRAWFCRPLYVGAAVLFFLAAELLALDGRMFQHLGITMAPMAGPDADVELMNTLTAMSVNGIAAYLIAWSMERFGTGLMRPAFYLLAVISPFAILQPLGYLVKTGDYSLRYDWIYLGLAVAITLLSHHRQRRSFYFAGLLNTATALWVITDHNEWIDEPAWAITVILVALAVAGVGLLLDRRERMGRTLG